MSLVLPGATSGSITIDAPAVAGTNILTLPASTGTLALTSQLPIAGPAFSVYQSSTTSVGTGATKITFDTEEFDTNNNFASSRFTPTVAGYYQINAQIQPSAAYAGGFIQLSQNGSAYKSGNYSNTPNSLGGFVVSSLVYCNGSSDYLEIYGAFTFAQSTAGGSTFTYFNGCFLRGA